MKTLRNLLLLTAVMLAGVVIAFYFRPQPIEDRVALGEQLGGNFTLQSAKGEIKLEDFKGKVVLFFIGYASCPDICPTALSVAAQGLNNLSEDEQKQVVGIFMSVDPDRDSTEKLAKYTHYFHDNFYGATADRATIDHVVKQYGAFYRMVDLENSVMGYAVDHSSKLYLIGPDGKLAKVLAHATNPNELTSEIRNLL